MMRRLTEYRPIIIRMEASRSMIFRRTLSQPVIRPATAPAAVPASVASQGLVPVEIRMAQTAPPSGKLPSTVRSGKRSNLNERSEEHTSELQSPCNLVCRLLLEKKKNKSSVLSSEYRFTHSC